MYNIDSGGWGKFLKLHTRKLLPFIYFKSTLFLKCLLSDQCDLIYNKSNIRRKNAILEKPEKEERIF